MDRLATALKALGHPERLRITALLAAGELTVSELVEIVGLSQPRVTQYVKSLEDAGLVERFKEGSWVFSRLVRRNPHMSAIVNAVLAALPSDDPTLNSDRRRLDDIRSARAVTAESFFAGVARSEQLLGDEYLPQDNIEAAIAEIVGEGPFEHMVDLGTGTGRMLNVLASRIRKGTGIDSNTDMLKVARHNLSGTETAHITVRQGDLKASPLSAGCADLVTLHQVLHFLDDPEHAVSEASRLSGPGGRVIIVDFVRHGIEAYRSGFSHRHLGFEPKYISDALSQAGLKVRSTQTISTPSEAPDVIIFHAEKPLQEAHIS